MSNSIKSQAKKPVKAKANPSKAQQTKALASEGSREAQCSQDKHQVNPREGLQSLSGNVNLLIFVMMSPSFRRSLNSLWVRHLDGKYFRMQDSPIIYLRIALGVKMGMSRNQLADLVGNGWSITINAFIKVGFAGSKKWMSRDYDNLVLTSKGERLYSDFMQEIEKFSNTIPNPQNPDNQK